MKINLSLLWRQLNYVLQALVNKSVNMVKQLFIANYIRKTSKSICLSYHYKVNATIKVALMFCTCFVKWRDNHMCVSVVYLSIVAGIVAYKSYSCTLIFLLPCSDL